MAQAPFASYKVPTKKDIVERMRNNPGPFGVVQDTMEVQRQAVDNLDKADFFDHANANIVFIQNGKKLFPTINGEVINYKLGILTTKRKDGTKRPHFLPISLITKVSGNYNDSSAGATNDAVSYFGSPLTFRVAPSFELTRADATENKLFIGMNADARMLTIGDAIKNELSISWGFYGSVGLTYMGKGFAFEGTDESERFDGKWSFSTLLYYFKSGGDFNKTVLKDAEKKTLSGVELLLRFKTNKKEDSKFNFLISASNGFTRTAPNFAKWEFRVGVGN
jgi:hypothetical protein